MYDRKAFLKNSIKPAFINYRFLSIPANFQIPKDGHRAIFMITNFPKQMVGIEHKMVFTATGSFGVDSSYFRLMPHKYDHSIYVLVIRRQLRRQNIVHLKIETIFFAQEKIVGVVQHLVTLYVIEHPFN